MKKKMRKERPEEPRCMDCGATMKSTRANYRYRLVDDWAVTLTGVEILKCSTCGAESPVIDRPMKLHRTIAAAVVQKKARLAPPEVSFLRQHVEMNGRELARLFGSTPSTVSRWENGHEPIGATADRLLRTVVMLHDFGSEKFDYHVLADIGDQIKPLRLTLKMEDGEWKAAAA